MPAEMHQFIQQAIGHTVLQTVEHVQQLLRGRLQQMPQYTQVVDYIPGLLSQLPSITVSAEAAPGRRATLGNLLDVKQGPAVKPPPSATGMADWGPVTGDAQPCRFTLSFWAVTRAQLDGLYASLLAIDWTGPGAETTKQVEYTWEDEPAAVVLQHRWHFRQCRLTGVSARYVTSLATPPPLITINHDTPLLAGPADGSDEIGRAVKGAELELLGRSADGSYVQGGWLGGQAVWLQAGRASLSAPLEVVPVVGGLVPVPPAQIEITAAAKTGGSAWRQDLQYTALLEATQEPVEETVERIAEIDITWQTDVGDSSQSDKPVRRTKVLVKEGEKTIEKYVEEDL